MEILVLHLPKIQKKEVKKLYELFEPDPLPDTLKKYRGEECVVLSTTEETYPFSLKPEHIDSLYNILSFNDTTFILNESNILHVKNKKLFKALCEIPKLNYFLEDIENKSLRCYCKEDPLKDFDISFNLRNNYSNIVFINTAEHQKEVDYSDYTCLQGLNFYLTKVRDKTIALNLLPAYLSIFEKKYKSQFTGAINFHPISIVGPHINFSYYIPNTLGYDKNMDFYHRVFESVKEIDLKDPGYNKSASLAKPISINKRLNTLYNYFLSTTAKQDIDNIFGKGAVIDSNNQYSDKYRQFSYPNKTSPDPIAFSNLKRAAFTKDNELSTVLNSSFIFEKYLANLTSFITTDSTVNTELLNLLIYGAYIHNMNSNTPQSTFQRSYCVRIKTTDTQTLYYSSCTITLSTDFKKHLLSNSSLFNTNTAFIPMFVPAAVIPKKTGKENYLIKNMAK